MFIKLTLRTEKKTWVNVASIESITDEGLYSNVLFRCSEYPMEVKETPEKIIELMSRMKK